MEQKSRLETTRRDAFIVRIWQEAGQPGWQGWVQHVRTRESAVVRSADELVAFIEEWTDALSGVCPKGLH
jgi:hypothetical protein